MHRSQSDAQLRANPFDSTWHTTQSLTRGSSLRTTHSPPLGAIPASRSLNSTPLSALPEPAWLSQLEPPPPARSRSQEALRSSPNPFLSAGQPISTNPFTGQPTVAKQRSLTPDFGLYSQQQQPPAPAPLLQPTAAPFGQGASSLAAPLAPAPAVRVQQWVTFDDDSDFAVPGKTTATLPSTAPRASPTPAQTQNMFPNSGFDSAPSGGAPPTSLFPVAPPPVPARANQGPQAPLWPSGSFSS